MRVGKKVNFEPCTICSAYYAEQVFCMNHFIKENLVHDEIHSTHALPQGTSQKKLQTQVLELGAQTATRSSILNVIGKVYESLTLDAYFHNSLFVWHSTKYVLEFDFIWRFIATFHDRASGYLMPRGRIHKTHLSTTFSLKYGKMPLKLRVSLMFQGLHLSIKGFTYLLRNSFNFLRFKGKI